MLHHVTMWRALWIAHFNVLRIGLGYTEGTMKTRVTATLSALALAAALAPLPSPAANGGTTIYTLSTRQYDSFSAGEYDGRMRLQVSSGGLVGGTFIDSEGHIANVVGGLTGKTIWLEIGNRSAPRQLIFNGTFVDGKLKAMAPHGLHDWTLEGTPVTR